MKKVLALMLAVVLAFGMATTGFAAYKIDGIEDTGNVQHNLGWSYTIIGANKAADLTNFDFAPNEEVKAKLYLNETMFHWTDRDIDYVMGNNLYPTAIYDVPSNNIISYRGLTTSVLSSGNVNVTAKKTKGYPALDTVKIKTETYSTTVIRSDDGQPYRDNNGNIVKVNMTRAYVEVKFIKELVSVKSEDFEYDITLTYKKTKVNGTTVTITGTVENPIIDVDEDNDTVDLSDGSVAEAMDYVRGIEVTAGNGVTVIMNMFEDAKYYIKASESITAADETVMDENPEIDHIITMKTASTNNTSIRNSKVELNLGDRYYVYDADGKYIGLSSDTLPFSSKYYLASERIDLGDAATGEEPGTATPTDPGNPNMGGDDYVVNENDNPGTGVNGFVNVAMAAGMIALAAAGAVALKK